MSTLPELLWLLFFAPLMQLCALVFFPVILEFIQDVFLLVAKGLACFFFSDK
jgi:hypothetical protein